MIKTTIRTLRETTRALLSDRSALAIFAGLYALLLTTLYGFIATREATVWQVLLTLGFLVLAPAEFFITQAAIVAHARHGEIQWRQVLGDSCKLLVITLPVIGIGWALFYLLNKWQAHYAVSTPVQFAQASPATPLIRSSALIFATVRSLLFWIVLPLTMIHLWIGVTNDDLGHLVSGGAGSILKRTGRALADAFAPQSVMIYVIGFVLFALVPYAVLFVQVPVNGIRTDFAVFVLRILLVYLLSLVGWLITLNSLTRIAGPPAEQPVAKAEPEPHLVGVAEA
jgi:hypothetical protein